MSNILGTKIVNRIIFFSLIGISIISLKNYVFSKNTDIATPSSFQPSPALSDKKEADDPEVPCVNRYLNNFDKKATWKYKITTTIQDDNENKQTSLFFKTHIIEASASSLLFETTYDTKKDTIKTEIQCKKSGIYGAPFPLFMTSDVNLMDDRDYAQFNQSIRIFPPNQKLTKGEIWNTTVNLDHILSLPIPLSPILHNTVINNQTRSFSYRQNVPTIKIQTDVVFNDETFKNFNDATDNLYTMSFGEDIGIIDFNMHIYIDEIGIYKTTIQLIDFKTNPN